jgi:hypothetical protein
MYVVCLILELNRIPTKSILISSCHWGLLFTKVIEKFYTCVQFEHKNINNGRWKLHVCGKINKPSHENRTLKTINCVGQCLLKPQELFSKPFI